MGELKNLLHNKSKRGTLAPKIKNKNLQMLAKTYLSSQRLASTSEQNPDAQVRAEQSKIRIEVAGFYYRSPSRTSDSKRRN